MQLSEIKERGKVLQSQLLLQLGGIEHFSSTKASMKADADVWMPKQIHSTRICVVKENGRVAFAENHVAQSEDLPSDTTIEADAVITQRVGQWIGVRTADCVPVLLFDPKNRVVAAVHAGWRGTVGHIVQKTIRKMKEEFGCAADDIYAMVGPSISPEQFEVGQEVADQFIAAGRADCIIGHYKKTHIDLWQSNVADMLEEGIDLGHIDCTPPCTKSEEDMLYSARREGIETGRIVTAIRLI